MHTFLESLDPEKFRTDFLTKGSSNYALNIVMKDKDFDMRDRIETLLSENNIEFRRGSAGGGNQLRQPFLKDYIKEKDWEKFPETEHIHHFCWYVGNYPSLEEEKIKKLCQLLNQA